MLLIAFLKSQNDSVERVDYTSDTWLVKPEGSFVRFSEDRSYSISFTIDGLENRPIEQGNYTLEGSLFTFISTKRVLPVKQESADFTRWSVYQAENFDKLFRKMNVLSGDLLGV